MISEKAKSILLIIGIILACLLLIQGFGFGIEMEGKKFLEPLINGKSSLIINHLDHMKVAYLKF